MRILGMFVFGGFAMLTVGLFRMDARDLNNLFVLLAVLAVGGSVVLILALLFIRADVERERIRAEHGQGHGPAQPQPPVVVLYNGRQLEDKGRPAAMLPEIEPRRGAQPMPQQSAQARRPRQWGYVDGGR